MSYKIDLKSVGVTYIGGINTSAKMIKSYRHNVATYCIYLAPANMAGRTKKGSRINVCPMSQHCKHLCLNSSGHNKADILCNGEKSRINICRIKKTKLFYNDRETFMRMVVTEINRYRAYAKARNMDFAIRLNGTSDLSPELFKVGDKNILELYPNIQFYDYTKVPTRLKLMDKYSNYDLTFSFDGYNWETCEKFLQNNGKVAVVFDSESMPKSYKGYRVIDANDYDMRYLDDKGCIMGLHYHPVVLDGKLIHADDLPDTELFVVRTKDNPDVIF